MNRAFCAIFLTTLFASVTQAGYVGEINLSSGAGSSGSLTQATGGPLVGTNLSALTATSAGGTSGNINGFFDFKTGAQTSNDGNGNITYAAGGNFFVLPTVVGTKPPPFASSLSTGVATQTATGTFDDVNGTEEPVFSLTMSFSGAYINAAVADLFGTTFAPLPNRLYSGSLTFNFVGPNLDSLAGSQLLGGSISFDAAPEPSSFAMVVIGGLGLLGYGRRRLRRAS
jgi:PEP-CTERM motif